jgi:D-3-phosphoglycerate dehydrogenase
MNALPVVIVTHTKEVPVDLDIIYSRLNGGATIRVVPCENRPPTPSEEQEFIEQTRDAVVIFQRPGFITRNMIEACPNLKFVITHGAGVDKIDLQACAEMNIWVGNVPGGNATAVAELVVAGIINLSRKLITANTSLHRGGWKRGRFVGRELSEGVLGIIGFGYVGRRLAELVSGFGTKILFYDPYFETENSISSISKMVSRCDNLNDLLRESDFISIHVPLTKVTDKFIGHNEFKIMKKECIIANTSRGNVIDEDALCFALSEGIIGGAVMDVFAVEPLPKESPLGKLSNVILTPHVGGSTWDCLRKIAERACDEILLALSGNKPKHIVEDSGGKMGLASRV